MNLRRPAAFTAIILLALPLHAAVLEDFSGYGQGDSFSTGQTLGTTSGGWSGGWRTSSSYIETVGRIETGKPIDASPYLDVTLAATAGQPNRASGAISRPYPFPAKPFKLTFRFRPGVADDQIRYFLFDNDIRAAGPGPSATWQIESRAGYWCLIGGQSGGLPETVIDTELPLIAGTVYTFSLEIDPVLRLWGVTLSDGIRTVTRQNLAFRTATPTAERWIHFGANELAKPALGITATYSIDSISLQP
jgi:hypothetical protein